MNNEVCPECGGVLKVGKSCEDYFHQMITWDFEDFLGAGSIHHLTVLCFNLQHPSKYSREGLNDAKNLFKKIVEEKLTEEQLYERNKEVLASDQRSWKIVSSSDNHGNYIFPIIWSMTASDVIAGGLSSYVTNVRKWAQSIYGDLDKSNNF